VLPYRELYAMRTLKPDTALTRIKQVYIGSQKRPARGINLFHLYEC
jgi:hypothetical protein